MWISHLALNDFRNYRHEVIEFEPGVTVLVGQNGQGKTNMVEAISYLATLTSHRNSPDNALIRAGAEAAVIRAKVIAEERDSTVDLEIYSGRANRARINRGNAKPRDVLGLVRAVVFAPEDLALVSGDPATRRRFLDDVMVQHRPRMAETKTNYEKTTRQRAALLKDAGKAMRRGQRIDEATFAVWNQSLARFGAQIITERHQLTTQLEPLVTEAYERVAPGRGPAHITYLPNLGDPAEPVDLADVEAVEQALLAACDSLRQRELERGVNLVGPHRDELELVLGELPAKGYASHGETWSFALSLRLASWELLSRTFEDDDEGLPILILDDVFAELDATRRERLAETVARAEQVFVTAAVGDDVPDVLAGNRIRIHGGEVVHSVEGQ